jgi:hypothetical protein
MYVIHEVHRVRGREADTFADLYRTGWGGGLSDGGEDARLLWFLEQGHGGGPSYTFVTLTGVASLDALAALHERVRHGDLRQWQADVDALRYEATAKLLVPTTFSPWQSLDLREVPAPGSTDWGPELPLFMEDTAWPHPGMLDAYLAKAGSLYVETLERAKAAGFGILDLVAAFQPLFGAGPEREIVLWQRVAHPKMLVGLFQREVRPELRAAGTWMHDALEVRDQWQSRLLRVAAWSPLA